jgi:hypothetical protein
VITSVVRRLSLPLAMLVGGALLSGCSGEENVPLKKVDFVLDAPPKDYKETRKAYTIKGASSKVGRDPSGVSKGQ